MSRPAQVYTKISQRVLNCGKPRRFLWLRPSATLVHAKQARPSCANCTIVKDNRRLRDFSKAIGGKSE